MIAGVGADVMRIDRIAANLPSDDPFIRRGFTEAERAELEARADKRLFLASRFAAKEAVFKSLNASGNAIPLHDVEILKDENGKPFVNLYGAAAEVARNQRIDSVMVSLSSEDEYVLAFAVAEATANARTEKEGER